MDLNRQQFHSPSGQLRVPESTNKLKTYSSDTNCFPEKIKMDQDIDLKNLLVTFVHTIVWRVTTRYLQLVTNW